MTYLPTNVYVIFGWRLHLKSRGRQWVGLRTPKTNAWARDGLPAPGMAQRDRDVEADRQTSACVGIGDRCGQCPPGNKALENLNERVKHCERATRYAALYRFDTG